VRSREITVKDQAEYRHDTRAKNRYRIAIEAPSHNLPSRRTPSDQTAASATKHAAERKLQLGETMQLRMGDGALVELRDTGLPGQARGELPAGCTIRAGRLQSASTFSERPSPSRLDSSQAVSSRAISCTLTPPRRASASAGEAAGLRVSMLSALVLPNVIHDERRNLVCIGAV
jgi:hypothetical protein